LTATPTAKPLPKYHDCRVPLSVSITTPAVRLVVVECWAHREPGSEEWELGHSVHQVIALQAELTARFSRPHTGRPRLPPSVAAAELEGWGFDDASAAYDVLIYSEEFGAIRPAGMVLDAVNVAHEVVPAPWPVDQDEERLAATVAELKAAAIEKAAAAERRYGVPAPPAPAPEPAS
jgi:hypothetical protein